MPVFLPDIVTKISSKECTEDNITYNLDIFPMNEGDMIARLKDMGYKILKPQYVEV